MNGRGDPAFLGLDALAKHLKAARRKRQLPWIVK
jgi:hypothetical protein